MREVISSKENKKVKLAKSLQQKKFRKLHGLMLIEGKKIIDEAIKTRQQFLTVFIDEQKVKEYDNYFSALSSYEIIIVTNSILKLLSPTQTPQGILAIIKVPEAKNAVIISNFLLLDNIQDPGNLGAIIRSAAATGFTQIFMLNCVDATSDKVVRASMGNLFYTNNIPIKKDEFISLLKSLNNYELYVANMNGVNVFEFNKPKNKTIGLIIGNEGNGVSEWLNAYATQTLSIPMQNEVESLNAAVSASILMYEFIK